jgi:hypothetical protein
MRAALSHRAQRSAPEYFDASGVAAMKMNKAICLVAMIPFALAVLAPVVRAENARAVPLPIEDKDRADMAKQELKSKRELKKASGSDSKKSNSACGTIDIGNTPGNSNAKGGQKLAEQNKTVIVTGNIYNTASCN